MVLPKSNGKPHLLATATIPTNGIRQGFRFYFFSLVPEWEPDNRVDYNAGANLIIWLS